MDIDSHTHTASGEAVGRSSLHPPKKRHKSITAIASSSQSQSPHNNISTNTNTGNYNYNYNFNFNLHQREQQRTAPTAACNSSVTSSSSCYNNLSALEHETASLASYSTSMTASRYSCCPSSPPNNMNMNTNTSSSLSAYSSPSTHGLLPAYIIAIPPIPNLRDADCTTSLEQEEHSDRVSSILPTSTMPERRFEDTYRRRPANPC